jgi:nitroreductase
MKNYYTIIISVLILLTNVFPACAQNDKPDNNAILKVIQERKSVRHFTGETVSKGDLNKILKAGMSAPTAVNKQPWSFVVVTDRATLDTLAARLPSAKMLFQAGAAIIICAIPEKANGKSTEFAVIDWQSNLSGLEHYGQHRILIKTEWIL